ncbi:SDR family oxidoreductase [bacterium]|nr:MAG: SDR family oxidoreductase [bacterium]
MSKIALITGANKGIGFETARQLGNKGYTVLLGARDETRGEEAAQTLKGEGLDVQFLKIDPTDADSVAAAAAQVEIQFGHLDVLVNNAGVLVEADQQLSSLVPTSALRETYDLNVFALHEVTRTFWPLLEKSEGARLVNVSSLLGSLATHADFDGIFNSYKVLSYDSSKAAVNMLTVHYAHQWKDTPHKANAIHPGSVKTDMNPAGDLKLEEGARTSVDLATIGADGPNGGFFHLGETLPW